MSNVKMRSGVVRYPDETIPMVNGGAYPCRFWNRSLCTPAEAVELEKKGWIHDTTRFAMDPAKFEVREREAACPTKG